MKTIQAQAIVTDDHTVTLRLPEEITPGLHTLVVVIDERVARPTSSLSLDDFPVIDVGPRPEGLSLRREDLYGDDGRSQPLCFSGRRSPSSHNPPRTWPPPPGR
jgi:hypothetical protein